MRLRLHLLLFLQVVVVVNRVGKSGKSGSQKEIAFIPFFMVMKRCYLLDFRTFLTFGLIFIFYTIFIQNLCITI